MVNQNGISNFYDTYTTRQLNAGINARHKFIHSGLKKAGLQPSHSVLEVGCGIGTQSSLLLRYLKKGTLTALDISPKSIEIAKQTLKRYKKGRFIATDVIEWETEQKFNVIVLPDVIEHIPEEKHKILFNKLAKLLDDDGFIFINIPHPEYLKWCHSHRKHVLQIIDQPIFLQDFLLNLNETDLFVSYLKDYSLWIHGYDYRIMVLKKKPVAFPIRYQKSTFLAKVKFKLRKYVK